MKWLPTQQVPGKAGARFEVSVAPAPAPFLCCAGAHGPHRLATGAHWRAEAWEVPSVPESVISKLTF